VSGSHTGPAHGAGEEVLSSYPESPPRRKTTALVLGVAALALAAGIGLGVNLERATTAAPEEALDDSAAIALVGGSVTPSPGRGRDFVVAVFNAGSFPVDVLHLDANTIAPDPPLDSEGTTIEPGTWRDVPLQVSSRCSFVDTLKLAAVVSSERSGTTTVVIGLSDFSPALENHFVLSCSERAALAPAELVGLWLVDPASRSPSAAPLAMRFRPGGLFELEAPGTEEWDIDGRYRLRGPRLSLRIERGRTFGCEAGDVLRWQATLVQDGRLALEFPRRQDACGEPGGVTWLASRLAAADGSLPDSP
jgi:hypothetical protein